MATDVLDDQEMREAQRDYLDFLDDDVSLACCSIPGFADRSEKEAMCWSLLAKKLTLGWIYTPDDTMEICAYDHETVRLWGNKKKII